MRKQLLLLLWITLCLASLRAQAQTPVISGTLSVSLTGDANNNGLANPSDQLSYSLVISNTGSGTATGVNLTMPAPTNTTLVTGSLKTSTLARPDTYTTLISGTLNATTVLTNDFGLPTKTVLSFGPSATPASTLANGTNPATTDQGGTVVMNTDGTFSYTPTGSFVGYDRFGYTATTTTPPNDAATVTIGVGTPVTANADSYAITGNLTNTQTVSTGVLLNDTGDQKVVTAVNGNTANVGTAVTTTQSGTVTVQSDGSFVYEPPAGYTGTDSFTYTANNGLNLPSSAVVTLTITGMIWFVNSAAPAGGTGTLARPFNTLGAFQAVNNGTGNNPAAGDNIFLYSGTYTESVTLLATQKLIGQGASASLASIAGITPAPGSAALPATGGTAPALSSGSANVVTLGQNNLLRGIAIGNSTSFALTGNNFGTLTVSETPINTTNSGLGLNNGTVSGSFPTITSTGGTNNISLTALSGTFAIVNGTLSGATGTAFNINGGTATITYNGSISQASNAALVSVSGGHTSGTLLFQNGTLSATNGTGLQFDNADGTYTFSGTTTLNGGDAGIDIIGGSGGTFTFPASTAITNPSGSVINIASSAPTFTYSGTFTKTSSGTGINFQNNTGGSISINGTGTKTLSTGISPAINLATNTGAIINFSGNNLALTTSSGTGFNATGGGTVNVTGTGNTITTTTGTAVNITTPTNIGGSGVTFRSITVNNGGSPTATNAIVLNGTTGSFLVTGDGSQTGGLYDRDGSGGTLNRTTGHSVLLTNAQNVTLRQMNITNTAAGGACPGACTANGVNSVGGSNIVLSAVLLQNLGGNGWRADNLTGGTNGVNNNSRIENWQTLTTIGVTIAQTVTPFNGSFTIDRCVFTTSATGADGFLFDTDVAGTGTVTVTNSEFTLIDQDAVQINNDGSGTLTAIVQKNNFHDADATDGDGNNTLFMALSGSGQLNFTIGGPNAADGNTFTNLSRISSNAGVLQVNAAGGLPPSGSAGAMLNGSIQNNILTNPGFLSRRRGIMVAAEASAGNHGGHKVLIANNSIQSFNAHGIYASLASVVGSDLLNNHFTIRDNTVGTTGAVGVGGGDSGSAIEFETFIDADGNGGDISANILIQGNTAVSNNNSGIGDTMEITNRSGVATGTGNSSLLNVTVLGNNFTQQNAGGQVFELRNSTLPTTTACLDLNAGNTNSNTATGGDGTGFRLRNDAGTFRIEGLSGAQTGANVQTFLTARNSGAVSASNDGITFPSGSFIGEPAGCPVPTLPTF